MESSGGIAEGGRERDVGKEDEKEEELAERNARAEQWGCGVCACPLVRARTASDVSCRALAGLRNGNRASSRLEPPFPGLTCVCVCAHVPGRFQGLGGQPRHLADGGRAHPPAVRCMCAETTSSGLL